MKVALDERKSTVDERRSWIYAMSTFIPQDGRVLAVRE